MPLSLLTWNVAGRVRSVPAQQAALATCPADVVALQEIRATAVDAWLAALGALGYDHVLTTLAAGTPDPDPVRRLGVLIAARHPLLAAPAPELPWPERHLAAIVRAPDGPVEVRCVHSPISSKAGAVKVRTLEALAAAAAAPSPHPVLIAGDLNTPQYESRDGEVRSFARTRTGRLRTGYDERHDRAELGVVPGLAAAGYVDAFRAVHGYGARDRSWVYPGRTHGYRLDHVFARGLRPVACAYVHTWREEGLSDHSALIAELAAD